MSGLVLSRASLLATRHAPDARQTDDFWCENDLCFVCHNLAEAATGTHRWKPWPLDREGFADRWLPTASDENHGRKIVKSA